MQPRIRYYGDKNKENKNKEKSKDFENFDKK